MSELLPCPFCAGVKIASGTHFSEHKKEGLVLLLCRNMECNAEIRTYFGGAFDCYDEESAFADVCKKWNIRKIHDFGLLFKTIERE